MNLACFEAAGEWAAEPFHWGATLHHPQLTLQLACCQEADEDDPPTKIRSWVNGAPTPEEGSHVDGVLRALQRVAWRPTSLMVHVMMLEPCYAGPVKRKLVLPHVADIVDELVSAPLAQAWAEIQTRRA